MTPKKDQPKEPPSQEPASEAGEPVPPPQLSVTFLPEDVTEALAALRKLRADARRAR